MNSKDEIGSVGMFEHYFIGGSFSENLELGFTLINFKIKKPYNIEYRIEINVNTKNEIDFYLKKFLSP